MNYNMGEFSLDKYNTTDKREIKERIDILGLTDIFNKVPERK